MARPRGRSARPLRAPGLRRAWRVQGPARAVQLLIEANKLLNTWIGQFELGQAYLAAGLTTQASSEFDRCIKRKGEALALFLDEEPTFGIFPAVYYYQGRAGSGGAYEKYLQIRGKSSEDALAQDARKRLDSGRP